MLTNSRLIALFAVLAGALVFVLTRNGIALSPDSYAYLNAAWGMRLYGGIPADFTWWPPLYPLTLAPFAGDTTMLLNAAKWLNAACYGLSTAITLYALKTRLSGAGIAALGVVFLLAPPFDFVHRYVWSEPLFVTLTAAWFALLLGGVRSWRRVILLALVAALLGLQRYVGLLFVPFGVFALLLYRAHWKRIAVYAVIAFTPLALWMLRNVALGYPATGLDRGAAYTTITNSMIYMLTTVASWLPVLTLACAVGWRYRVELPSRFVVVAGYYAVGHALFIVWSSASTSMDEPDNRLLAPAFVACVYCAIAAGDYLRRKRIAQTKAPA